MGMKGLEECVAAPASPFQRVHSPTVGMNSKQVRIQPQSSDTNRDNAMPDANLSDTWNCGLLVEFTHWLLRPEWDGPLRPPRPQSTVFTPYEGATP
jgi:hypothetical protein